jgi:hypothetical protein
MQSQHIVCIGLVQAPQPLAHPWTGHGERISQLLLGPLGVLLPQPASGRSFGDQVSFREHGLPRFKRG